MVKYLAELAADCAEAHDDDDGGFKIPTMVC
jgi:hypothetical protein